MNNLNEEKTSDFIYKTLPGIVDYKFTSNDVSPNIVGVSFATINGIRSGDELLSLKHLNMLAEEFEDDNIIIRTGCSEIFLLITIKNPAYFID